MEFLYVLIGIFIGYGMKITINRWYDDKLLSEASQYKQETEEEKKYTILTVITQDNKDGRYDRFNIDSDLDVDMTEGVLRVTTSDGDTSAFAAGQWISYRIWTDRHPV